MYCLAKKAAIFWMRLLLAVNTIAVSFIGEKPLGKIHNGTLFFFFQKSFILLCLWALTGIFPYFKTVSTGQAMRHFTFFPIFAPQYTTEYLIQFYGTTTTNL